MAHKHLSREAEGREAERHEESSLLSRPADTLRGLVQKMESVFQHPLDYFSSALETRLDIEQLPKELVVRARLPGYSKEDIAVDLTEDSITVSGRRSTRQESRRHEGAGETREEVSFSRSMSLPAEIKTEGAKASFKDGRLEIRLPRTKEARVRRVDIGG